MKKVLSLALVLMLRVWFNVSVIDGWSAKEVSTTGIVVTSASGHDDNKLAVRLDNGRMVGVYLSNVTSSEWVDINSGK